MIIRRLIIAPFLLLGLYGVTFALLIFPLSILMAMSIYGLIVTPMIWLLRWGGSNMPYVEGYFGLRNAALDHLLSLLIPVYGSPFITVMYVIHGPEILEDL